MNSSELLRVGVIWRALEDGQMDLLDLYDIS